VRYLVIHPEGRSVRPEPLLSASHALSLRECPPDGGGGAANHIVGTAKPAAVNVSLIHRLVSK
jgi:hypothetical protein